MATIVAMGHVIPFPIPPPRFKSMDLLIPNCMVLVECVGWHVTLIKPPIMIFTRRQTTAPISAAGTGLDYVSHQTLPPAFWKGSATPD